jgi:hypothetical protein
MKNKARFGLGINSKNVKRGPYLGPLKNLLKNYRNQLEENFLEE